MVTISRRLAYGPEQPAARRTGGTHPIFKHECEFLFLINEVQDQAASCTSFDNYC